MSVNLNLNLNKRRLVPNLPKEALTDPMPGEVDVLARTIWGEARGEPLSGQRAIAAVVLNRVEAARKAGGSYWWGNDIASVCTKPKQFSCWNGEGRAILEAVNADNTAFLTAQTIARAAVADLLEDPTEGATHFHSRSVSPFWAKGQTPTAHIGEHVFYRLV